MTALEKPAGPSCPACTGTADVERIVIGQHDRAKRRAWCCYRCWTVFHGGQDEWNRMRPRRDQWRSQHEEAS